MALDEDPHPTAQANFSLMSSSKPLIVVCGATGAQGGSVVKFLLEDGSFAVRGLTRNADSAASKALASKGVEVVATNFDDPASIAQAFKGAYGVFGLTNFWDPTVGYDGEIKQGKALVDAAKAEGVKHFVWSTLDHSPWKVPHWESKAFVDDYLKESGLPRTSLYTSWYYENVGSFYPFEKNANGELFWDPLLVTDAPRGSYSVTDTGAWVVHAFKHPEDWIGKDLRVVSSFITAREIANKLSEAIGKPVHLKEMTLERFESLQHSPDISHELWLNEKWFVENPYGRDLETSKKIHPKMKTWDDVVHEIKDRIVAGAKLI